MTTEEKYAEWLKYAQYDLDTSDAMYSSGRWLYVSFMCQQAIEKLVKGLYVLYISDDVPRVHNISSVFEKFSDKLPQPATDAQYLLFDTLTSFYMNTRYPEYKEKISAQMNQANAKALIEQTKEVFAWLLTMKP